MRPAINLDMDGPCYDLEGHFLRSFGLSCDAAAATKEGIWHYFNQVPDFFSTMPLQPGAREFFDRISHLNPAFLTCCPAIEYEHVANQKRIAIRRDFGNYMVLPVCGHLTPGYFQVKHHFMQNPGDILIDDYGKNCRAWEAAGGVAIKWENWTDATQAFFEAMHNAHTGEPA